MQPSPRPSDFYGDVFRKNAECENVRKKEYYLYNKWDHKQPSISMREEFNKVARDKYDYKYYVLENYTPKRQPTADIIVLTPPPRQKPKEDIKRGPSFFEQLANGLSRAFASLHDQLNEPHRRKTLFKEAMKVIEHASFLRPNDAQTWLFRADVAREMDALNGRHYYNSTRMADMPAHLRKGVDAARREIAFQTITGPVKAMAETLISGGTAYDIPDDFVFGDEQMQQALIALETINQKLGTPIDDIDAWVRREEAAEEMAALMGDAIPQDILEEMNEDFAHEVDAKRRYVAFKRLTGGLMEETLSFADEKAAIEQEMKIVIKAIQERKFG